MTLGRHEEHIERHLDEARTIAHEARATERLNKEGAHGIFQRLDASLANAARSAMEVGSSASHRIAEEIHRAREELKEWYNGHEEGSEHHHTFDGFHRRIDAWMEDMRESGREW